MRLTTGLGFIDKRPRSMARFPEDEQRSKDAVQHVTQTVHGTVIYAIDPQNHHNVGIYMAVPWSAWVRYASFCSRRSEAFHFSPTSVPFGPQRQLSTAWSQSQRLPEKQLFAILVVPVFRSSLLPEKKDVRDAAAVTFVAS